MTLTLLLKLTLVPFFLGLISLVGKRYGPSAAGWLAGLPVIVGPILFLLAIENGTAFAARAATFTLASVLSVIAFGVGYAWSATRAGVLWSCLAGLVCWFLSALFVASIPFVPLTAALLAYATLIVGPLLYPRVAPISTASPLPATELFMRMLAGALLTLLVTAIAESVGERWSGIAALAPLLTPILAVFTHQRNGAMHAIALLRALVRGLFALATFCLVLALWLPTLGMAWGFALGIVAALSVHGVTFVLLKRQLARQSMNATSK